MKNKKREPYIEMYQAILSLETLDECVRFFDDLCSVTELNAIEQRYQVARMLNDGHIYSTIQEKTGASSATISRVNRSLHYGADSYDIIFKRLDENAAIQENIALLTVEKDDDSQKGSETV